MAYFAWLRHTGGKRIGGGIARSYYVGVEGEADAGKQTVVCVVPQHLEEGQDVELKEPELELALGQPVTFPLFTSTVRGDDAALKGVKLKKAAFKRVAEILRAKFQNNHNEDADGLASSDGLTDQPEGEAADVGCLIGEMHLHNQEFHKAIEAFSRAIAIDPTPDAHAGRARAYRALAALDDHAAAQMREKL